jgi:GPH family glycoside/pentoside/hexuronide:cation symporter
MGSLQIQDITLSFLGVGDHITVIHRFSYDKLSQRHFGKSQNDTTASIVRQAEESAVSYWGRFVTRAMTSPLLSPKLTLAEKLAYGAGDLGPAMTANLLTFYQLIFFTDVVNIPAGLASLVLVIGKVWDAVNDPIVGVMSDRTQSAKWGRRYPWMLWGAIPFGITFVLQWVHPAMDGMALFWFYVVMGVLFNTAYTAVNLPYTALTPEMTQDYDERTSLNGFRFTFSIGGSLLSIILMIIISPMVQDKGDRYLLASVIIAMLSITSLFWCVMGTKNRTLSNRAVVVYEDEVPFLQQVKIAFSNRPFLYVIGIYLCSWLALQITATVIPFFVGRYMLLSDGDTNFVVLAVQGTALLALSFWSGVSARYGKKATYFAGMGIWLIAQVGLFLLQPGQVMLMYALAVMTGLGVSTAYLIPWSMLPDVIDLDELQTGQRREGLFYAFMVLLQKIGLAVGIFLVGQGLALSGYRGDVKETPMAAILAIRVSVGPLPTVFLIAGVILAYFYPVTKAYHDEVLLKLADRKNQT